MQSSLQICTVYQVFRSDLESAEPGYGVVKIGNVIFTLDDTVPEDSEIYQLVNTTVVKSA